MNRSCSYSSPALPLPYEVVRSAMALMEELGLLRTNPDERLAQVAECLDSAAWHAVLGSGLPTWMTTSWV